MSSNKDYELIRKLKMKYEKLIFLLKKKPTKILVIPKRLKQKVHNNDCYLMHGLCVRSIY